MLIKNAVTLFILEVASVKKLAFLAQLFAQLDFTPKHSYKLRRRANYVDVSYDILGLLHSIDMKKFFM